ncbi:MAG: cytochrome C oxidase subunit IV family protein [Planctomycetota bacterium]
MADALKAHPYAKDLSQLSPEDRALLADGVPKEDVHDTDHHDEHALAHPVPLWMLYGTFGVLMVLSILTVAVTKLDFGPAMNLAIAIGIAVVKAAFVAVIFMHLRWDNPFNTVALVAALLFLLLFVGITIIDTGQYQNILEPPGGAGPPAAAPGGK